MHEFSLVQDILTKVLEVSREHGGLRVTRVALEGGALCQVVPDLLHFAFDASVTGTPAEGAALDYTEAPARILCTNCERTFEPEDVFWLCPACGAGGGRVLEGNDLILQSVELEEPEPPEG